VIPDEDIEWATSIALEVGRRVIEQHKRVEAAEFRDTHLSYTMGYNGVEKFVATPELRSETSLCPDPLDPGQVWTIGEGGADNVGLNRIEVTETKGSGVRILNAPAPAPFKQAVSIAEQNLYSRSSILVSDRDPRVYQFSVQLRSYDTATSGTRC